MRHLENIRTFSSGIFALNREFASCDDVEGKCVDESRKAPLQTNMNEDGFDEVLS